MKTRFAFAKEFRQRRSADVYVPAEPKYRQALDALEARARDTKTLKTRG